MSTLGSGAQESIQHVVYGIVFTAILNALIASGFINHWFAILASVINVGVIVAALLILGTKSVIYLIGWVVGIVILLYGGILGTGLIGTVEMIIYLVVPLGFSGLKIFWWYQSR